ncbi:hypothetical protein EVAR_82910_1 [Eumeta japonica]|uniref:Uncharacterized protein n=1 Tax=Eumeta variegata TaxID=151549 RepID=A0A4C1X4A2_EUMVA|nr:hypothetical protein EVAR_82910_1 [Eumeta japonica]
MIYLYTVPLSGDDSGCSIGSQECERYGPCVERATLKSPKAREVVYEEVRRDDCSLIFLSIFARRWEPIRVVRLALAPGQSGRPRVYLDLYRNRRTHRGTRPSDAGSIVPAGKENKTR